MKAKLLALLLLVSASSADGFQYWNNVRHSALLPDETVTIRTENPSGAGISNYLLYEASGVNEEAMTPIADGPSTVTATVPGPVSTTHYYGFRLLQSGEIDFMPVRIPDGSSPLPAELTRVATDAVGDELFGYGHLDLVDCRTSFSGTRLYAALTNTGGGFPVNQGFTFFGYLMGIVDPSDPDPAIVFALMYTFEQAGIIEPGLYKITGTGLGDLEKIGDVLIDEYPAENTLLLSCELTDLTSDPDFAGWYDPVDPTIGVAGFTQRITLTGGAQEADRTPGGRCYLREFSIAAGVNSLPQLDDLDVEGEDELSYAVVDYTDPDGNCPVLSEIVFDGTNHYPMYPVTLDYSLLVEYRSEEGIIPLVSGNWSVAVARFSDNISDVVEDTMIPVGVDESILGQDSASEVRIAPNPFTTEALFYINPSIEGPITIAIFDVAGRKVAEFGDIHPGRGSNAVRWDGRDDSGRPLRAGSYFYRLDTERGELGSSLRLLR